MVQREVVNLRHHGLGGHLVIAHHYCLWDLDFSSSLSHFERTIPSINPQGI